ncbi:hypothetical protein HAX54_029127, partial [Datura stramonium]|nr:hypothetical protein [Datura stramonium]
PHCSGNLTLSQSHHSENSIAAASTIEIYVLSPDRMNLSSYLSVYSYLYTQPYKYLVIPICVPIHTARLDAHLAHELLISKYSYTYNFSHLDAPSDTSLSSQGKVGVPREVRDCMLGVMLPYNPLRGKGAPRKGRKERNTDSEDDNVDPSGEGASSSRPTGSFQRMDANLTSMGELLAFRPHMEGMKKIYRTLLLGLRVPPLSLRKVSEYSFLIGGKDEEANDPGNDSNDPSI